MSKRKHSHHHGHSHAHRSSRHRTFAADDPDAYSFTDEEACGFDEQLSPSDAALGYVWPNTARYRQLVQLQLSLTRAVEVPRGAMNKRLWARAWTGYRASIDTDAALLHMAHYSNHSTSVRGLLTAWAFLILLCRSPDVDHPHSPAPIVFDLSIAILRNRRYLIAFIERRTPVSFQGTLDCLNQSPFTRAQVDFALQEVCEGDEVRSKEDLGRLLQEREEDVKDQANGADGDSPRVKAAGEDPDL